MLKTRLYIKMSSGKTCRCFFLRLSLISCEFDQINCCFEKIKINGFVVLYRLIIFLMVKSESSNGENAAISSIFGINFCIGVLNSHHNKSYNVTSNSCRFFLIPRSLSVHQNWRETKIINIYENSVEGKLQILHFHCHFVILLFDSHIST